MSKSIVIIEDDRDINAALTSVLEEHGYEVQPFLKAEDFVSKNNYFKNESYLIDWNLPGLNGVEVIKNIRSKNKTAAIFLMSASGERSLPLEALGVGADHFLKKPFDLEEMLVRFENAHKKLSSVEDSRLDRGIKLFPESQLIFKDGECLKLTPREFKIIETLFNSDKPVPRKDIISKFDASDKALTVRNIDVHINALRKKIGALNIAIKTVWGIGYTLQYDL